MKTYFGSNLIESDFPSRTVVAIGNFDGVHLGHQAILRNAHTLAKSINCKVVCLTFHPHPIAYFRPEIPMKLLMTYEEKRKTLAVFGVDFCVEENFDSAFSQISAHDFFFEILQKRLHSQALVVGSDFAFGKKREGTVQRLKSFCDESGMSLQVVNKVQIDGVEVSSSRIRAALAEGDVERAAKMLGRPFSYSGEVIHGDKRGRTIGFPTANMKCEEKFPLKPGVYATSVFWREKEYLSVTNIGTRPTFESSELKIETHILEHTFELYGEVLEVRFHFFLRSEKKFSSVDELKAQITTDTILAKMQLRSRNF